jgi:hypothetical protein
MTALAKRTPKGVRKSAATGYSASLKAQRAEQMEQGEGWNHVVRGGVLSRPPTPNHIILNPLLSRSRRGQRSLK